jgi:hypothetical protein
MQIKRQEFLSEIKEEMELRKAVRQAISLLESKKRQEEQTLRQIIRRLISEGSSKIKVHDTTAGNYLERLFSSTNFLDTLRNDYHALRTSPEQRSSFSAHVLHAMKALLERDQLNRREDDEADQPPTRLKATPETGIDINITDDETEQERSLETEATEKFQMLPGMDETGAQAAERTWNTLEPLIVNELTVTLDPRDRAQFAKYLLLNTTGYLKEWEESIQSKEGHMGQPAAF